MEKGVGCAYFVYIDVSRRIRNNLTLFAYETNGIALYLLTSSFRALPGLNLTTLAAGI